MVIAVYFLPPLLYIILVVRSFVRSFAPLHLPSSAAATIHPTADTAREEEEEEEARFVAREQEAFSPPTPLPKKTLPHSARGEERLAGGSL